ncbi:carbon-nitrogen hydrolase family protein [Rhodobacteraceae bacterium 63075]|nr:carbon-nitrogen hydrolase family protein [Rhodobacteraceae bacterium 63075]
MRIALLQLTSSEDPAENLRTVEDMVLEAARGGAEFVLTPEVTNCIASSRKDLARKLSYEAEDPFLERMRSLSKEHDIWLLLGSLGVKSETVQDKFANRSFLIGPDGEIAARYDKIHMFDVDISETETYRESKTYERGNKAIVAQASFAKVGMSVCYDVRFPHLYRSLAQAGAEILTIPAAFAVPTGQAHWEPLLRARAIENGAFVLAPAQTGLHYEKDGKERRTYGHSMVIDPWGKVLLDAGEEQGVHFVDIELSAVSEGRSRVGSLTQLSEFESPK